jgi:2Fe-2S ferredoxin
MLDGTAAQRKENSRLSCQITLSDELDGLIVHLPEEQ